MNIKGKIKKYSYLVRSSVSEGCKHAWRRLKSITYRYNNADLDALNYSRLPYPFPWKRVMPYKKLYAEIGSGHGEQLKHLATEHSENLYVGFEIFKQFALLTSKRIKGLSNAFVFKADAYEATTSLFANRSLNGIYILFPDPWHKKRHHKRRPIVESWFRSVEQKLAEDGFIFFATDWEEYFDFVLTESAKVNDLYQIERGIYKPDDWNFAHTHYYKKWVKIGRKFNFIKLTKKSRITS